MKNQSHVLLGMRRCLRVTLTLTTAGATRAAATAIAELRVAVTESETVARCAAGVGS